MTNEQRAALLASDKVAGSLKAILQQLFEAGETDDATLRVVIRFASGSREELAAQPLPEVVTHALVEDSPLARFMPAGMAHLVEVTLATNQLAAVESHPAVARIDPSVEHDLLDETPEPEDPPTDDTPGENHGTTD